MSKFLTGRGIPTIPPVGKTKYIYIYTYIQLCQQVFIYSEEAPCTSHTSCSCGKVAILFLQDLSTLCVTDICGIYFHLYVQCS